MDGVAALQQLARVGAGAMPRFSSRLNPNPPAAHAQTGNLPATNAWTTRQSVFASEPSPMTPGIVLPQGTRLYVQYTTQTHGFIQAYWPGRGWNFVPFSDVMLESDYVRMNTPAQGMRPSSTVTLDGLPDIGLGIPGPWGNVPGQAVSAGTYEITGTQVYLHEQPSASSANKGAFNATYGANGDKVVGDPDQVDFDGQTGDQGGLRFASVTVKSGALAGKTGYVAMKYMAPVGWTASHGGTGPAPTQLPPDQGGGGGGAPPVAMTGEPSEKWKPWLIGGIAALAAGGALYLLFGTKGGKKARRRGKARKRLRRIRRRRR